MGGVGKKVRQAGRWLDGTTAGRVVAGVATMGMTEQVRLAKRGLKALMPKLPGMPELPDRPEAPPDLTDQALRAAAEAEATSLLTRRGRRASFLTAGLGAATTQSKTLLGG